MNESKARHVYKHAIKQLSNGASPTMGEINKYSRTHGVGNIHLDFIMCVLYFFFLHKWNGSVEYLHLTGV